MLALESLRGALLGSVSGQEVTPNKPLSLGPCVGRRKPDRHVGAGAGAGLPDHGVHVSDGRGAHGVLHQFSGDNNGNECSDGGGGGEAQQCNAVGRGRGRAADGGSFT